MDLLLLFTVRACLPYPKILYFIHTCEKMRFLKGNTPSRRTDWESSQKNFLYKEVHRVRTGADSVQKKYFPDCLVKTRLFLCHVWKTFLVNCKTVCYFLLFMIIMKQTFQNDRISQSKHIRDAFSVDEIHRLRKLGAKAFLSVVSCSWRLVHRSVVPFTWDIRPIWNVVLRMHRNKDKLLLLFMWIL